MRCARVSSRRAPLPKSLQQFSDRACVGCGRSHAEIHVKMYGRRVGISHRHESVSEIIVGIGMLRMDLYSPTEMMDCLPHLALLAKHQAEIVMGVGKIRID